MFYILLSAFAFISRLICNSVPRRRHDCSLFVEKRNSLKMLSSLPRVWHVACHRANLKMSSSKPGLALLTAR